MKVWIVLLLLAVCGCADEAPDSDNDGLLDKEEALHNLTPIIRLTRMDSWMVRKSTNWAPISTTLIAIVMGWRMVRRLNWGRTPLYKTRTQTVSDGAEVNNQTNPLAAPTGMA